MNKIFLFVVRFGNSRIKKIIYSRCLGVQLGSNVRFTGTPDFGSEPYLISIGNDVTITQNVTFHTHDGGMFVLRKNHPRINKYGRIRVGDNVFIGSGAMIMPNVTIGNNVIIAAGSIITRDIPSNSVYAGIPGRLLKTIEQYESDVLSRKEYIILPENLNSRKKKKFILNNLETND